jgi:GNAT superfamily N-acetyltransferase
LEANEGCRGIARTREAAHEHRFISQFAANFALASPATGMTMPDFTVRPLLEGDRAQALAIAESLPEWFDEDARTRAIPIDLTRQEGFVGESDGQVVAFITLYVMEGRFHIGWIAVRREFHRKGIGRALVHQAEAKARSMGIDELAVYTMGDAVDYPPYEQTRRFYLAAGFQVSMRKQTDNPGCPQELHMIRRVRPAGGDPSRA